MASVWKNITVENDILQSYLTNAVANKKTRRVWETILDDVNVRQPDVRTVNETKDKWGTKRGKLTGKMAERRQTGDVKPVLAPGGNRLVASTHDGDAHTVSMLRSVRR